MKTCAKCNQPKPLDEFYADKRNADGRRGRCKTCYREDCRARYADPSSGRAQYEREYQKRNRAEATARYRRWRERNRERANEFTRRWQAEHPERNRATARAYQKANPERFRHRNQQRRAKLRGSGSILGGHSTAFMASVLADLAEQPCFYCEASEDVTVDHIVPLARGGLHHPQNLVSACRRCNSSKRDQLLHEWRASPAPIPS